MHNFLLVKRWEMFVCYYTFHGGCEQNPKLISTKTPNPFTELCFLLHKKGKSSLNEKAQLEMMQQQNSFLIQFAFSWENEVSRGTRS